MRSESSVCHQRRIRVSVMVATEDRKRPVRRLDTVQDFGARKCGVRPPVVSGTGAELNKRRGDKIASEDHQIRMQIVH